MPSVHPTTTVPFAGRRPEPAQSSPAATGPLADIAGIVDRLVDAIAVRESFEPESAGWDTVARIRGLERELAIAWSAARPRIEARSGRLG